jgi:hypothetical protein
VIKVDKKSNKYLETNRVVGLGELPKLEGQGQADRFPGIYQTKL